jgi:LAS superfamily LD-carboxypeptidase LdcB
MKKLNYIILGIIVSILIVLYVLFPSAPNNLYSKYIGSKITVDKKDNNSKDIEPVQPNDNSKEKDDQEDLEPVPDTPPPTPIEEEKDTIMIEGKLILTDPASLTVLVNKERNLPENYTPNNLVIGDFTKINYVLKQQIDKNRVRIEVLPYLEQLFAKAKADDITIYVSSAYRSYNTQKSIFAWNQSVYGAEKANTISAHAGQSEHQTGLAIDFTSKSVNFDLVERFEQTPEGIWLANNAYKYGFILRYPKNKSNITGYVYEPWHFRFVGQELASEIHKNDLTLEEYFKENSAIAEP